MKLLKTLLLNSLTAMAVLAMVSQSAAISVSLQPNSLTVVSGDSASVDLVVSGLGNLSSPSLGGFDFDLSYDPAIISAVSLTFGSFLNLGGVGSLQFSDLSTTGFIHLDEISFEDPINLDGIQPDTFTLASLSFTGLASGISTIDFSFASLSDELGQSLTGISISNGSVEVISATHVPDSASTALLLLITIGTLSAFRLPFVSKLRSRPIRTR